MEFLERIDPNGSIAVEEMIFVKGLAAQGGSKILEGFQPLFGAEAVERLPAAHLSVAGTCATGEFGLDLLGETSVHGTCVEKGRLVSAAAALVAEGKAEGALCADLNGAPRRAAAVSGTVFVKPTYGTVSRYGLIPCACSGEQIGAAARDAAAAAKLLDAIAGHDPKDGTSLPAESYGWTAALPVEGLRVAVPQELLDAASDEMRARIEAAEEKLRESGMTVERVSFPLARAACAAWQILLAAESCNNLSRYDGVKFGYRAKDYANIEELYTNSRTEALGLLAKEVILYGSDLLSENRYMDCYDRALRVRRLAAGALAALFENYDLILAPPCSRPDFEPYPESEGYRRVTQEALFTALPNLCGQPAAVDCGVQLIAKHLGESTLLSAARALEEVSGR